MPDHWDMPEGQTGACTSCERLTVEVESLRAELEIARSIADFRCAKCERLLSVRNLYRCLDCGHGYCKRCLHQHFVGNEAHLESQAADAVVESDLADLVARVCRRCGQTLPVKEVAGG